MLPMLASDWDEKKQRFPVMGQPKIDGVRGLNFQGDLTGRSLKHHANRYTSNFYSIPALIGLDGELAAEDECHPDLCRITTSALNTIVGEPFTLWHVFDYVTAESAVKAYEERYRLLEEQVRALQCMGSAGAFGHLRFVPAKWLNNMDELLEFDELNLDRGYEGTILRDPRAPYKHGRSTVKEGGLLRIKRFVDSEAVVISIEEGKTNLNAAQVNELGLQFRSSHSAGMVPNGQVGAMLCRAVADVYDPVQKKKVLIHKGDEFVVSPGRMPASLRKYYFENQHELIGQVIKYKFFPKGIKDKPRFPTFQTIRAKSDIS